MQIIENLTIVQNLPSNVPRDSHNIPCTSDVCALWITTLSPYDQHGFNPLLKRNVRLFLKILFAHEISAFLGHLIQPESCNLTLKTLSNEPMKELHKSGNNFIMQKKK